MVTNRTGKRMQHKGFTLIELMVTLAVLAILLAIAAPSFSSFMLSQRIKTASFDVIASLSYARSEAIKQNGSVTIAPVSGTDWASGWTITGPSGLLRTQAAFTNLSVSGPTNIIFGRSGRVTSTTGSILVDDSKSNTIATSRCITIDPTGIPRAKSGACS